MNVLVQKSQVDVLRAGSGLDKNQHMQPQFRHLQRMLWRKHAYFVYVLMSVFVWRCVNKCLTGSVTLQTQSFVTASECCGAVVHAISPPFLSNFHYLCFLGPQKSQHRISNTISLTHTETKKHTNNGALFSKPNDLKQFVIQPADAICFSCFPDSPFSWDLHVLYQSKKDRKSNLCVSRYKVQMTLRGNTRKEKKRNDHGGGGGIV